MRPTKNDKNFRSFKAQSIGQKMCILGPKNYRRLHTARAYEIFRHREIIRLFLRLNARDK